MEKQEFKVGERVKLIELPLMCNPPKVGTILYVVCDHGGTVRVKLKKRGHYSKSFCVNRYGVVKLSPLEEIL